MKYDVVVAGGGVAGVAAAVEAARSGKKVALIEKSTQLGGLATIGLINLFEPLCNGRGTQIIKGMADEFMRLAIQYGFDTIPQEWKDGEPGQGNTEKRLMCRYSAPIFSLVLCKLLSDLDVTIYFDSVVTGADSRLGHIDCLNVFNKSGFHKLEGKIYVDATGDGDVMHYADVPTLKRGNFHSYLAFYTSLEHCKKALEAEDISKLVTYRKAGPATLFGTYQPEGKPLWDGTDGWHVSQYLVENQLELLEKIKDEDRKTRDIALLPFMPQFRTTRCIHGNHVFKDSDPYLHFADSICAISDFVRRDYIYEVPYGTLIRDGFDNVITAGRSASAEGYGWDILRVIPPAILTGQAAGAAASEAIDSGKPIYGIDVEKVQTRLADEDVMIHFDDSLIPEEKKEK